MIMIWIFAIITFLVTPGLAHADVPVFDGTTHTILRETKQLIDERTSILNQMIAGIFRKEIAPTQSGAAEDPAIQEIISAVESGGELPCNSLDCLASKITAQSMRNLQRKYQDRLEGVEVERYENGAIISETPITDANGNPINTFTDGKFYVPNYSQYFGNVIENEREAFLGSTLGNGDDLQIKQNLALHLQESIPKLVSEALKTEDFADRVKSTMPADSEGFMDDFTQGGFDALEALLAPENSVDGAYLAFLGEEQAREQAALEDAQFKLNSPGIIPTEECETVEENGKKILVNCKITNPAGQNVAAFGEIPIIDRVRASNGDELTDIQETEPATGANGKSVFIGPNTVVGGNDATRKNASLYNIDQLINLAARLIADIFRNTNRPRPTPTPRPSPTPSPSPTPGATSVSVTSPQNNAQVSGTVPVTASATGVPQVAGVQFYINGSPFGPEDTASPYTFVWDTGLFSNGAATITALVRDTANNTSSNSISVTINN